MNPPSTRIGNRRAPQRPLPDPHQTPSVSRRRSSRIEARQRSVSIPHILGRPTPQTSQPLGATSYTHVPTSDPIEALAPVPSRAQVQEYLSPPQKHNHQTRKRGPDRSIEAGPERPPKRPRLTKENLKAFEKIGGRARKDPKSKSPQSEPNSSRSRPTSKSSATTGCTSKTVSTTDSSFPRLAFENGILDTAHSTPPGNLDYLQDRLDRARNTASPTESEYEDFVYRIQRAPNEMTIVLETSKLLKRYGRGYRRVYNQAFNDFPKDVGLNNGLSAAQPDMVEGLDMTEFDPVPIRRELGGSAVPTGELDPPTLPHLAGEWKGPGKDMVLAQTQAAYDGACMVYARNKACSFLKNPDPAGHAFVSTFTTDGTILNTFANYSSETQPQVKYHHYPTTSSLLIATYEDHKKSVRRLRNQEDVAKEAAEKLRDELQEKWSANHRLPGASSVQETAESSYDYEDGEDPTNQLLAEYWTHNQYDSSLRDSSVQIPAEDSVHSPTISTANANNGYTTPPQSSKDASLPLESSEDINQSNVRSHRRTRRARPPADIVDARKTRKKR